MNKIMSVSKMILHICLLFMLVVTPTWSKATPNGVGWISNCYQTIYFGANGVHETKKLWLFGGKPVFSFGSTSGTDLLYFTARPYDPVSGVIGEYIDFPGHVPVSGHDAAGNPVDIYENDQPMVGLPEAVPSVIIDFYSPSRMYSLSLTIDFIGVNEAFKIQPAFKSCLTYADFQFKNDLVKLEGFCGELDEFKVKLPEGAPNTMGLDPNFSMDITVPSIASGAIASDADSIKIDWNQCSDPNSACPASSPCGCITFNLEFKLRPCPNTPMICASETTISKPIQVCCRCAVPNGNPEGEPYYPGRKADNTTLTGENNELAIFPNPNHSGKLQVNAPNNIQSIKIYAVDGRLVKEISLKELNQSKVSVDVSGLKPGMYQVQVTDQSNTLSNQKLVIQ